LIVVSQADAPDVMPDLVRAIDGEAPPVGYLRVRDQFGQDWWLSREVIVRKPPSSPLSAHQIDRIRAFKEVLAEHDPTSMEEALANFGRDEHPEREIASWERMARVYKAELRDRPSARAPERRLLFSAVLACSFGAADPDAAMGMQRELVDLPNLSRVIERFVADEGST
jgi:hypothetical protein